jgi:hypothetical protein
MKTLKYIIACLFVAVVVGNTTVFAAKTGIWLDDFSVVGPVGERYSPAWKDITAGRGQYFSPSESWSQRESLISKRFTEGTIEVTTGFDKKIKVGDVAQFASSGLVIKSIGDNVLRLRFGAYDTVQLKGVVGGKEIEQVKPFPVKINRGYRLKVVLKEGRLTIWIDDKKYFDLNCPISTEPGKTGLYCESPSWFDNYKVTGVVVDPFSKEALVGTPKLEPVSVRFRADLPRKQELFSTHGAIELYVRNVGDCPAELESISLNGRLIEVEGQRDPVAWYEQRPIRINPGEVGLVLMRMRGLPEKMGDIVMRDPSARPAFYVTANWNNGASRKFKVPFNGQVEPFQVNFMSFSQDLKSMWVYLQNNDWIHNDKKVPIKLRKVLVNGKDVTSRTVFGEKTLTDNIVPLAIKLDEPLPLRRDVTVLVQSLDGRWTGHNLRAISSRTIMQTCMSPL